MGRRTGSLRFENKKIVIKNIVSMIRISNEYRLNILALGVALTIIILAIVELVRIVLVKTKSVCSSEKTFCPSCWHIADNQIPIDVELAKKGLSSTPENERYVRRELQSHPKFPGCNLQSGCECIAGCQCVSGECLMGSCA